MDEPIATRRRGRPRKNFLSTEGNNAFENSREIEQAIDETNFEFINPENDGLPEVGNYNPLSEPTIERDYSKPTIQEGIVADLEEPSFHQKTFNEIQGDRQNGGQSNPQSNSVNERNSAPSNHYSNDPLYNPNPALNELDDREKRLASEHMVDAVLDTYETLSTMSGQLAKMDEQKVLNLIQEGKIDPNRRIPVDEYGNTVSVMEFVSGYNSQVGDAVKNDPAFRKKVRPVMVRVFAKRGWGMTDEQFLLFAFGKDISVKAVTLYAMKKGINDILNRIIEEGKSKNIAKPKPKANPTPPPPPPTQYEESEVEELSDDDIEFMERMERLQEEQEMMRIQEEQEEMQRANSKEGVDKMKITFDDNPLRENVVREYPAPKVEETFIKGGEIIEEPNPNEEKTTNQ